MGFVDSVKGFAGKVGESVERGAKTVSNNSKKFAEKNKVKRDIAHIEADINSDYIELGKALYEKISNDPDSEYAATIADIKEKNGKLSELKAVLMSLEDKMFCTNCGAQISKDQLFCDKCGAKVNEPEAAENTEAEVVEAEVVSESSEKEFSSEDVKD
ncbi:MAG: zinc ribbon domain-containing protein [Ruminococcus sp.]|uniref:zinc ribbon domain-containing protein n=1 Tax=Ruminococcus sp. TaxID=41978 RepID=UPI0025F82966|nr:zinc ribbon domain-containing protein [Ruminococcus sp.]MCR4795266.1 zinc ribbon domain-containing protein [Ruminococcus sp.]